MKTPGNILFLLLATHTLVSQTVPFRENSKWGIKENENTVIQPVYDTVFNFDKSGKLCLACFKSKAASGNKFIKAVTITYACNYLNKKGQKLLVRSEAGDTCSVFNLGRYTVKQYNEDVFIFPVNARGKRHLFDKDFNQLTFKGYTDISLSPNPDFYITQFMDEAETVFFGVINTKEQQVIPYLYSSIKFNLQDSLIVACSAGVRSNAEDDIYNYAGKKIESYSRHVDMVTKNFVVFKLFDHKEYFIIYNKKTKVEKSLNADEVQVYGGDDILLRTKNDWYIYDMNTNLKKPVKQQ